VFRRTGSAPYLQPAGVPGQRECPPPIRPARSGLVVPTDWWRHSARLGRGTALSAGLCLDGRQQTGGMPVSRCGEPAAGRDDSGADTTSPWQSGRRARILRTGWYASSILSGLTDVHRAESEALVDAPTVCHAGRQSRFQLSADPWKARRKHALAGTNLCVPPIYTLTCVLEGESL
jgi:hypothetical protein